MELLRKCPNCKSKVVDYKWLLFAQQKKNCFKCPVCDSYISKNGDLLFSLFIYEIVMILYLGIGIYIISTFLDSIIYSIILLFIGSVFIFIIINLYFPLKAIKKDINKYV
jgi:hypothetical protein